MRVPLVGNDALGVPFGLHYALMLCIVRITRRAEASRPTKILHFNRGVSPTVDMFIQVPAGRKICRCAPKNISVGEEFLAEYY